MVKLDRELRESVMNNTIIVLVENIESALMAGRFVLNQLYNGQEKVIFLCVNKVNGFGLFLMRNLSNILKDNSYCDLTLIKNKLLNEFEISPAILQMDTYEGGLDDILNTKYSNSAKITIVIGEEKDEFISRISQNQIDSLFKVKSINSIFLLNNVITHINRFKIQVYSESRVILNKSHVSFVSKFSKKHKLDAVQIH